MSTANTLNVHNLTRKRCFVGFDAFIDYITKPIAGRDDGKVRYFRDLGEYANFLAGQGDKSFSVELEIPRMKIGGNNPIFSDIMSRFGVQVVSAGAYGKPSLDPVFSSLASQCRLISFANPGKCTALEFPINKVMNYYNMDAADFTYANLLRFIGEDDLIDLIDGMDMVVLVNLGEQPAVLNIIEALIENVFPKSGGPKNFFVDLSDCSRMSPAELDRVTGILKNLGSLGRVILSTNENEFAQLTGTIAHGAAQTVPLSAVRGCREALSVDTLILRTLHTFYGVSAREECTVANIVVADPFCLTGAGDAQNAGICLGLLEGLSLEESLLAGVQTGNCFIRTGTAGPA
jgi:hypothetical protein